MLKEPTLRHICFFSGGFLIKILHKTPVKETRNALILKEHYGTFFQEVFSWKYCTQTQSRNSDISEGQEKYLRELSITPVGYFTGAIKNHSRVVSHRNYFARYFRGTGMIFPRLALLYTLDVI
jgi:hypothetical protein